MKSSKYLILFLTILLFSTVLNAQKYVTKTGHIKFFSTTPMENIEAHNRQVNSAFDLSNGNFVFKVLIKSFEFEKALMQEHFNENYMESDKFPNAMFSGKIENISDVDFDKNGDYSVDVKGNLTIHGVTKSVEQKGTFTVSGDGINANAVFKVKVADYDIKIAKAVIDNIAEEIEITVDAKLEKLK
ncbi:MAG: YceI family protein [Vicingaceae bacterium]